MKPLYQIGDATCALDGHNVDTIYRYIYDVNSDDYKYLYIHGSIINRFCGSHQTLEKLASLYTDIFRELRNK